MDLKEMFYALDKHYGSTYDALEELKSLASSIRGEPKRTASELEDIIEEVALDNELCPECFAAVERGKVLNETVEYQGLSINEKMDRMACRECGWIFDN